MYESSRSATSKCTLDVDSINFNHSGVYAVVSHYNFDLIFLGTKDVEVDFFKNFNI